MTIGRTIVPEQSTRWSLFDTYGGKCFTMTEMSDGWMLSLNFKWCDNSFPKTISNRLNICSWCAYQSLLPKRNWEFRSLMLIANIDLAHGMWRSREHREHRRCIPENLQWHFPWKRIYHCAFWPESRATTAFEFVRRRIPENLCVLALCPK